MLTFSRALATLIATFLWIALTGATPSPALPRANASSPAGAAAHRSASDTAGHAPLTYGRPKRLATLTDRQISESSGLACGTQPGVFWTHNDSGHPPALFAFDRTGKNLGRFLVRGAVNRDWEDIAAVHLGNKSYLLVADTGNNNRRNPTATLYLVEEPTVQIDPERPARNGVARLAMTLRFRFEGGAVNCEAVGFDPVSRTVVMISKEMGFWCKAYALPLPPTAPARPLLAKKIADVELTVVTALDISPDGRRLIALTYRHAYEFVRGEKQSWAEALDRSPRRIIMPRRRQGESLCFDRDGRSLYLTDEQSPCPLWQVPAEPGAPTTGPTASTPAAKR